MSESTVDFQEGDLVSHVTNLKQMMLVVSVATGNHPKAVRCEWVSDAGAHAETFRSDRLVMRRKQSENDEPGWYGIVTG